MVCNVWQRLTVSRIELLFAKHRASEPLINDVVDGVDSPSQALQLIYNYK